MLSCLYTRDVNETRESQSFFSIPWKEFLNFRESRLATAVSSQSHPDVRLRDQIKAYIRCEPGEDDDPLSFWRSNSRKFPQLQELARETLSQSASSVPVENMFSTVGLLLNGKRSALAPHHANWLLFIHDNFALYFKTQNDNDVWSTVLCWHWHCDSDVMW